MTLREVKVGQQCTVKKRHGEGAVKRGIMDMGLTKGVEVYVRKVAPLGDPMELNVRGYELSIRKADAEMEDVGMYKSRSLRTSDRCHWCGNPLFSFAKWLPETNYMEEFQWK